MLSLNLLARSIPIARDFVAGDLKKDLGLLAETHRKSLRTGVHAQVVAKHGTTGTRSTKILDQRLRQFRDADSKVLGKLATLLGSESTTDSESSGLIAALAMRRLVREYLKQPEDGKKSLAALIKARTSDSDLLLFARLWTMEMDGRERRLLFDHSWAMKWMAFPVSYLGNRRQALMVIRHHPSLFICVPTASRPTAWRPARQKTNACWRMQ